MSTRPLIRRGVTYRRRISGLCVCLLAAAALLASAPPRSVARAGDTSRRGQAPEMRKRDAVAPGAFRSKFARLNGADIGAAVRARRGGRGGVGAVSAKVGAAGDYYAVANFEFDNAADRQRFGMPGATVFNAFRRYADVFLRASFDAGRNDVVVDPAVKSAVERARGLVRVEIGQIVEVPPPPRPTFIEPTKAQPDQIIRGGLKDSAGRLYAGKGVAVAVIDSGLDFRNPDFITYDSAGRPVSRLLYLWDTTSNAFDAQRLGTKPRFGAPSNVPIQYPNGSSIGTLYTQAQLTAELRASTPRLPPTDLNGHGTACAGVAAGNGNNGRGRSEVVGVAPEADLIAVRVGGTESSSLENGYLLNTIIAWLDSLPELRDKPLVVSCSFGVQYAARDGQTIEERQLNERFEPGVRGRTITIAAGNEGDYPIHAEASFGGEAQSAAITWDNTMEWGGALSLYFDTADFNDIRIAPAGGTQISTKDENGQPFGEVNPLTGQYSTTVIVSPGRGGLYLYSSSGKRVKADAYALQYRSPMGVAYSLNFAEGSVSFSKLVGSPGTTPNAVTVGSYDWNDVFGGQSVADVCQTGTGVNLTIGGISCYSSIGYSRKEGVIKPDLIAPGEVYYASYAKLTGGSGVNGGEQADASNNYVLFNGTSAATPYVAGFVALMFERQPSLTAGEVKELLRRLTSDAQTRTVPNIVWGYGKLDYAAAVKILNAVPAH